MKRKLCILLLSACVACTTIGCGGDGNGGSSSTSTDKSTSSGSRLVSVSQKDLKDHVELGEYKGITVEKTVMDVTEDDIDFEISNILSTSAEEVEDPETKIAEGDIANIDYVGKKDGVAFDGGTAEDYDLSIGSGQFIEGFEEGLIGAKKGETRDLDLTFPEEYPSEDLAGQKVVFTVSVNAIKRIPELTEEWVTANTEYDTIDAYKESVREDLEKSNEQTAESSLQNTAWEQVLSESEIKEYPDEDLKAAKEEYNDSLNSYAEQMGQSVDDLLKAQGMTKEQIEEESQQYAEYKVKQNLILQAIMDNEGFSMDDEDSQKAKEQMEEDYGMSMDELNKQYGESTVTETVALTRIMDFIINNAEVNTTAYSADEKEGILTDEDVDESETDDEKDAEE